ncbi:hypothetical protein ACTMU2_22600 [Cupriavidus basilensis]
MNWFRLPALAESGPEAHRRALIEDLVATPRAPDSLASDRLLLTLPGCVASVMVTVTAVAPEQLSEILKPVCPAVAPAARKAEALIVGMFTTTDVFCTVQAGATDIGAARHCELIHVQRAIAGLGQQAPAA